MSYKELKEQVFEANMELTRRGLVLYTFGNASQIDRNAGVIAIKPSGVPYETMRPDDMVLIDLDNKAVEKSPLRASSDVKTHVHLYRTWDAIGGVVHTHSTYATAWAQAQLPIPCLGTTHADYVYGAVPCTAIISDEQIKHDYEHETGVQITDCIASDECKSKPMVLVAGHAPFTWGKSASEAVYHSVILEELARMSYFSLTLNPMLSPLKAPLLDKHYLRKHGTNAYYGQEKEHK